MRTTQTTSLYLPNGRGINEGPVIAFVAKEAVAACGSKLAAAEKLGITRPTLDKLLRNELSVTTRTLAGFEAVLPWARFGVFTKADADPLLVRLTKEAEHSIERFIGMHRAALNMGVNEYARTVNVSSATIVRTEGPVECYYKIALVYDICRAVPGLRYGILPAY
ncbi:hypothetical protein [Ferrimonas marina]|uniref:Uncharacterized protein n=1 Tax=Ferrimonas marina TaxID=299255 RepID=A0A1M5TY70_9GAMM|nr:hypothetical protein [Ferrimonas marina]SHH55601.1 hypothetical protein SAMN02745129_2324 [Ferrimonas marina]